MRDDKVLWALFLVPTLLPDMAAGVSLFELLSIFCHFSGAALLAGKYTKNAKVPRATWLLGAYLAMSFVGLTHDPIGYFVPYFAGGLAFTAAVIVGGSIPSRLEESLPQWLFLFIALAASLDIAFDYTGWFAHSGAVPWKAGVRGRHTSQSLNGMYLAPLAAAMIAFPPSTRWRVCGASAIPLVFYHVVVIGQGRGTTALAALGVLAVLARNLRKLPTAALGLIPLFMLVLVDGVQEAIQPFKDRVESEDLGDVDRLEHAQVGERLLLQMSTEEALTGIWYKKVIIANGGDSLHNAFFDVVTRFGVFATTLWALFYLIALFAALISFFFVIPSRTRAVVSAVVIQVAIASLAAPMFVNWRNCIIPGLCSGLALQALRKEVIQ